MINPLTVRIVMGVLRSLLLLAGGSAGAGLLSDDDLTQLAGALVVLGTMVWSAYQKYRDTKKLATAMATPEPVTEAQVERMVDAGHAPPATLLKTETPYLPQSWRNL